MSLKHNTENRKKSFKISNLVSHPGVFQASQLSRFWECPRGAMCSTCGKNARGGMGRICLSLRLRLDGPSGS